MKNEFEKIKVVSIWNALYHALAAVLFPLIGYLGVGKLPIQSEWLILLSVFLGAFFGDIFKRNLNSKI